MWVSVLRLRRGWEFSKEGKSYSMPVEMSCKTEWHIQVLEYEKVRYVGTRGVKGTVQRNRAGFRIWIRIQLGLLILIRIRNGNPDMYPDPGDKNDSQKLRYFILLLDGRGRGGGGWRLSLALHRGLIKKVLYFIIWWQKIDRKIWSFWSSKTYTGSGFTKKSGSVSGSGVSESGPKGLF